LESAWRGLIADIERVATPRGREVVGCYSVEGTRLHERAVRAGVQVERAVVGKSYREDRSDRIQALLADLDCNGCRLETAPDEAVETLTEGRSIGAIVGLVRLPAAVDLGQLVKSHERPADVLVVLGADDPGNLGALVRTAHASGAAALVTIGAGDVFHPKAVRTSMGSLFKLPVPRYRDADALIGELAHLGLTSWGAVARDGTAPSKAERRPAGVAVFVGGEAFGLPDAVAAALDQRVSIPMPAGVDSFSVNAAAAILLYELRRGRCDGSSSGSS